MNLYRHRVLVVVTLLLIGAAWPGAVRAQSLSGPVILDATDTADVRSSLPIDVRTQKPLVVRPAVDPEVVRRMLAPFFKMFFKTAVKVQKPTSSVAPPADAPGTEVKGPTGIVGAAAAVGRAVASAAVSAARQATQR